MCKHYQLKNICDSLAGWQWPDDNYNEKHFFSENNVQCYEYINCE